MDGIAPQAGNSVSPHMDPSATAGSTGGQPTMLPGMASIFNTAGKRRTHKHAGKRGKRK